MRDTTIARNYAEVLLELARRAGELEGWGQMLDEVAGALASDQRLRHFIAAPQVSADQKNEILARAFQDRMPRLFVRFLQMVVTQRRQALIPEIAAEYRALLDEVTGRVHAKVTVARDLDPDGRMTIAARLSQIFAREVVPHMEVDPRILGGVVVRVGDTVMDGSVRRRLGALRQRMLAAGAR